MRSPKLEALEEFMEKEGIDVIQFNSAVKVGEQGVISKNIHELNTKQEYLAELNR